MRGGAIAPLAWAALLTLLLAGNWVWTGDALQIGEFAFAVLVVVGAAALVRLSGRDALRRGPPPPSREPEAVPDLSAGAPLAAVGAATLVFGLAFGRFLVMFGAALLVVAAGRLAVEIRAERHTKLHWEEEQHRPPDPPRPRP